MTICYFGIYDGSFGRNRVYIKGLRENGVEVIECNDTSPGFLKYWRLWKTHRTLRGKYDVLVVGYPGHAVVPLAKLISRKPVIADLLGSLSDAEIHSHNPNLMRRLKSSLADRLAIMSADIILLESEAQKQYFEKRYGASKKYRVLYTGADDSVFHCESVKPSADFVVLFRGRLTPESGILHILEAARFLKNNQGIKFRVIGSGPLLSQAKAFIAEKGLANVELISERLSEDALREKMCEASLSLGQFEDNPRLSRTIPHKAFESFAMGIPYLSGDAPAIREIVTDGKTGFLVTLADSSALAEKILSLRDDPKILAEVRQKGRLLFEKSLSPVVLGAGLMKLLPTS